MLFVGRVSRQAKGVFDLLSAWTQVQRACPNALLTIVGEDRTGGRFSREAHSFGLDRSIKLTGPLPSPVVAELMHQSRLLCLPSHAEGYTKLRDGSIVLWSSGCGNTCGWDS